MDEFIATLVVIGGLVLRIGIPVGVTAILVYALRQLDQRWQREATQTARLEVGRTSLFSQINCWAAHKCPHEERDQCPAFLENNQPCWQVFRDGSGELRQKCLDCPVFAHMPTGVPV